MTNAEGRARIKGVFLRRVRCCETVLVTGTALNILSDFISSVILTDENTLSSIIFAFCYWRLVANSLGRQNVAVGIARKGLGVKKTFSLWRQVQPTKVKFVHLQD